MVVGTKQICWAGLVKIGSSSGCKWTAKQTDRRTERLMGRQPVHRCGAVSNGDAAGSWVEVRISVIFLMDN